MVGHDCAPAQRARARARPGTSVRDMTRPGQTPQARVEREDIGASREATGRRMRVVAAGRPPVGTLYEVVSWPIPVLEGFFPGGDASLGPGCSRESDMN